MLQATHLRDHARVDPTHCPACRWPMMRVRVISRSFQDDMEVWECRSCGASIAQTVDAAKLAWQRTLDFLNQKLR